MGMTSQPRRSTTTTRVMREVIIAKQGWKWLCKLRQSLLTRVGGSGAMELAPAPNMPSVQMHVRLMCSCSSCCYSRLAFQIQSDDFRKVVDVQNIFDLFFAFPEL